MSRLHGCIISESVTDPMVVNCLEVYRALISEHGRKLDDAGGRGRWHLYFVRCDEADVPRIQEILKRGWYAHFWHGADITVVYADATFQIRADDRATWAEAIAHGRRHGIPDAELDFLTS